MTRMLVSAVALAASLALATAAAGHDFDHPAPPVNPQATPGGTALSAPLGAWEHVATIATGNPHTDIDFFEKGGETYLSAGTLAIGPYGGGQTIVQLTQGGEVPSLPVPGSPPMVVSQHPSASCLSHPTAALGLQHDVEATPKGDVIFSTFNDAAHRGDPQLLIDATDAGGRCHDQGPNGLSGNPRGGLEIVDITDLNRPVEIGLISHIGEAHTVNVDPKRPHIAFAVTSDTVSVSCNAADTSCSRANGLPLDGFEVVDLSSCMNFAPLTPVAMKRGICRPDVYRYRYESPLIALGHSVDALAGCHELEIYPDDRLACASINASLLFDLSGAFDDRGTPDDFSDDRPRGTPLPCRVRDSATQGQFTTAAKIVDCVDRNPTAPGNDLDLASYAAPSLEGVVHLGTAFHQGRGGANDATQDIDVSHEAELSGSGKLLLVTDERGGGVSPPGATCVTSPADHPAGNGGIHAYRVDGLLPTTPSGSDNTAARNQAWTSYAQKPGGGKAIYRAPINTGPQGTLCTAHVFHQIPGQNRIFMGWYTQGTQVVDFVEHEDGSVEFKQVGYFIPPHANTWTSAVFKMRKNGDGTFTYWGATGDFSLGAAGRSAVDVWKVTLPAPPRPRGVDLPSGDSAAGGGWLLDRGGGKLNFGFTAEDTGEALEGDLQLNDKAAGVKIHIDEITAIGEVEEGCGAIEAGPRALEFRGTGRFNGAGGKEFRVCVDDGGEPNKEVDRFHLECEAGCSYDSDGQARDDVTDGGNIRVHKADAAAGGGSAQPTTLILDPVNASGQLQRLTVRVLDRRNEPVSGAGVSLTASGGQTLTGVTGANGLTTFAPALPGEYIATAGGVQSNAIELVSGL